MTQFFFARLSRLQVFSGITHTKETGTSFILFQNRYILYLLLFSLAVLISSFELNFESVSYWIAESKKSKRPAVEARESSNFVLNILSRSSMFSYTKAVTSDSDENLTQKKLFTLKLQMRAKIKLFSFSQTNITYSSQFIHSHLLTSLFLIPFIFMSYAKL